ncbi:VOC family protein [Streptomyces fractus]|uniref:VOC family protein n=1 Tax=Streptomyces fractus TaxID=641806 RepID=UPI003CE7A18B
MTTIKKVQITFDCAEPVRVARFWCEVLGYAMPPGANEDESWSAAADPKGEGPRLFFQRVPEGKVVKNRVHIDVRAGTGLVGDERLAVLEAEAERLYKLGATHVLTQRADEENESCITLQDIEGNEFCLD